MEFSPLQCTGKIGDSLKGGGMEFRLKCTQSVEKIITVINARILSNYITS